MNYSARSKKCIRFTAIACAVAFTLAACGDDSSSEPAENSGDDNGSQTSSTTNSTKEDVVYNITSNKDGILRTTYRVTYGDCEMDEENSVLIWEDESRGYSMEHKYFIRNDSLFFYFGKGDAGEYERNAIIFTGPKGGKLEGHWYDTHCWLNDDGVRCDETQSMGFFSEELIIDGKTLTRRFANNPNYNLMNTELAFAILFSLDHGRVPMVLDKESVMSEAEEKVTPSNGATLKSLDAKIYTNQFNYIFVVDAEIAKGDKTCSYHYEGKDIGKAECVESKLDSLILEWGQYNVSNYNEVMDCLGFEEQ